jgi:hypothetical protein
VKFESNLVVKKNDSNFLTEDTPLSSTTRTGTDGRYHIDVVWGDRQKASVSKDGYLNYVRNEIILTTENNTIDIQMTPQPRQTAASPWFLFFPVLTGIVLAWLIVVRKHQ